MALYDGFFDAVLNEETGEFDRAYGSGDFTGYFANLIGSGVCVYKNPDSFKVRFENEAAVVSPGYLFIEGYWLKNDEDYTISVTGDATLAIVAHLNMGKRMIELEAVSTAESYPDSLVLALVDPAAGTAEDTRRNTEICGVIEPAGELAKKVEWAVNYIDNEIEDKLAAAEAAISEQSKKLDDKIAEVQAQINKIAPPPVGTIKFSAAQDMGPDWLPCNGDFITEDQYPDLVAALGKLTPSGDKFKLISDGEIGPQISNGVIYNGRMWVYSFSAKKLYGVDLNGTGAIKEISLSSSNEHFKNFILPTAANPIALSIVPHQTNTGAKLFLGQIIHAGEMGFEPESYLDFMLLFSAEFSGQESSLTMSPAFNKIIPDHSRLHSRTTKQMVPYVCSRMESGREIFYSACICNVRDIGVSFTRYEYTFLDLYWSNNSDATLKEDYGIIVIEDPSAKKINQRVAASRKNKNEYVAVNTYQNFSILSLPSSTFYYMHTKSINEGDYRSSILPLNIIGSRGLIASFSEDKFSVFPNDGSTSVTVSHKIQIPSSARVFVDAGAYLWGKDIYMIFVGTGIIFSRTLKEGSFGYLDTTSVLGTITQFGYLDYSQDEGTLYLLGQDTSNRVKVAKIVLNTLYDYANNGAWLPTIAADGVPAYIKAVDDSGPHADITITVKAPDHYDDSFVSVVFNGDELIAGTYTRTLLVNGKFTVGCRIKKLSGSSLTVRLNLNGQRVIDVIAQDKDVGTVKTASYKVADFVSSGITLQTT